MSNAEVKWIAILFIGVAFAFAAGVGMVYYTNSHIATSCVSAGGNWVENDSHDMECRR